MSDKLTKPAPIQRPNSADPQMQQFIDGVKQNLDSLMGQHVNAKGLSLLKADASLAEVIAALNVLIARAGG